MSGICSSLHLEGHDVDLERLRTAALAASYRGPDGIAYLTFGDVGLAHLAQRSTPEAAGETQPALSDDRRLCVIADVHLDHRETLTARLRAAGTLRAAHPGDAQLLLAAYERWVEECPAHLDGQFAFALWDGRKGQLFCARDRHGGRPLHFAQLDTTLWVGSDPRQLLALPEVSTDVDATWLATYLVDLPGDLQRTPFHQLRQIPPGWRLIAQPSGIDLDRVPSPAAEPANPTGGDDDGAVPSASEDPTEAVDLAILSCLHTSSSTVGLLLGDDSAGDLLATLASRLNAASGHPAKLLALLHTRRELPDGLAALTPTGAETTVDPANPPAERQAIPLDSPVASWETAAATQLRSLAEHGATVLLTTLGRGALDVAPYRPPTVPFWLTRRFLGATGIEETVATAGPVGGPIHTLPWPLATTSLHRTLTWIERTAAEHGIEVRHPFLDRHIEVEPEVDRPRTRPPVHAPSTAIVNARENLAAESRLVTLGICHPTRFPRALADVENATGEERDALWRALTLEQWLQTHNLKVAW